jgi:hypothetical protein
MNERREPFCPLDVPDEVWKAVAANYDSEWSPAPNYHVEYRDARVAYRATLRWLDCVTCTPDEFYRNTKET